MKRNKMRKAKKLLATGLAASCITLGAAGNVLANPNGFYIGNTEYLMSDLGNSAVQSAANQALGGNYNNVVLNLNGTSTNLGAFLSSLGTTSPTTNLFDAYAAKNPAPAPQGTTVYNAKDPSTPLTDSDSTSSLTVKSVSPINITTAIGTAPVLPATVQATMSDGSTANVAVTWASVAASSYAAAGTFAVSGSIAYSTVAATANVTVSNAPSVSSVSAINVTTVAGTAPVLPATVTATMSDGSTSSVAVTWGTVTASQYAAAGTFAVTGTIAGSTVIATANVVVTAVGPLTVSSITSPNLAEVQVMFSKAVDSTSAENVLNYNVNSLGAGTDVAKAVLGSDGQTVTLYVNATGVDVLTNNSTSASLAVSNVKDTSGNIMAAYNGSFATADSTVPQVVSVAAPGTSSITVTYSEPVLKAEAIDATQYLVDGKALTVASTGSIDSTGTVVTLSLASALTPGNHTVQVLSAAAGVTNYNGIPVAPQAAQTVNVPNVTALASVASVTAANQTSVTVTFSQPVNVTTASQADFYWNAGGTNTPDTVKVISPTQYQLTFNTNPLPTSQVDFYVNAVKDFNGNPISGNTTTAGQYKTQVTATANATVSVSSLTEVKDNKLQVVFSGPVLTASAQTAGYYVFTDSKGNIYTPDTATYDATSNTATLNFTTAALAPGTYSVAISGVNDLVGGTVTAYANSAFTVQATEAPGITHSNIEYGTKSILINFGQPMATTGSGSILNANNYEYNDSVLTGATLTAVNSNQGVFITFPSNLTPGTDKIAVGYLTSGSNSVNTVATANGLYISPSGDIVVNTGTADAAIDISAGTKVVAKSATQIEITLPKTDSALGSTIYPTDFAVSWIENGIATGAITPVAATLDSSDATSHSFILTLPSNKALTSMSSGVQVATVGGTQTKDIFGTLISEPVTATLANVGIAPSIVSAEVLSTTKVIVNLSGAVNTTTQATNLANSLQILQNGKVVDSGAGITVAATTGTTAADTTSVTLTLVTAPVSTTAPVTVNTVSQGYVSALGVGNAYLTANTTGVTSSPFYAQSVTLNPSADAPGLATLTHSMANVLFSGSIDTTSIPNTAVTVTVNSNGTIVVPGVGTLSGFKVTTPGSFAATISFSMTAVANDTISITPSAPPIAGAVLAATQPDNVSFTSVSGVKAANGSSIDASFSPVTTGADI